MEENGCGRSTGEYSSERNHEAVNLAIEMSRPVGEVAHEIRVHEGTLGTWINNEPAEHTGSTPAMGRR